MRPSARFQVDGAEPNLYIDSASFERYNDLAGIIASLDTEGTAQLYRQLLPLMDEAYAELGIPEARFSDSFRRAVSHVLEAPIIEGRPTIEQRASFFYAYTDPELEGLSAAQKQLLGMGPDNLRTVQAAIRDIALAIGLTDLPRGTVLLR